MTTCINCKQEIPSGASLCHFCKSHQYPWKNHLQYFSGIAAVIVLIVSGLTWLWSNRYAVWHHDDVRIISLNSSGSIVIANRGSDEVFLSNLLLTMPDQGNHNWIQPSLEIDERLKPNEYIRKEFPKSNIGERIIVRNISAPDFKNRIIQAVNNNPCFKLEFHGSSDYALRTIRAAAGPTLNTFPVSGYLEYWTPRHDEAVDVPIAGTGIMWQSITPECLSQITR